MKEQIVGIITFAMLIGLGIAVMHFELQWYIGVFLLGLGGVSLGINVVWIWSCRNESGCFSGFFLVVPIILIPSGLSLI